MNPLVILGVALSLGWLGVWALMQQQVRREDALEKKIKEIESRTKSH